MKSFFKAVGSILLSTVVLFLILEIVFRFIGAPGASRFVEKLVIQEKLTSSKPKGEFRIFAYGESTIHGSHYGPMSNTMRWCEAYMKDYLPGYKIKFVNFGRIGHGSDFIYKTFKETLFYKPDLAVFYMGHNDFLFGNRKDQIQSEKNSPSYFFRNLVRESYFISTLIRWTIQQRMKYKQDRSEDRIEFDKIETPPMGIGLENVVARNMPRYKENVEYFRKNVERITALGQKRKVPLIFFKPVSNLKDFAPFHSIHMTSLKPASLKQWESYYQAALRAEQEKNDDKALEFYLKAYELDPTYAELDFRMGRIYFKRGDIERAKKLFEEARDNDAIIYRATGDILKIFDELSERGDFDYIDTEKILISEVPGGILGEPVIEDNVHFSIPGHSLTGRALASLIAEKGWVAPKSKWQFQRERPYEAIARDLGINEALLFSADLKMVNYFGSRFDNRVRFAKKALEINPKDPNALRHLAWTYWLMNNKEDALEVYEELNAVSPKALAEVFKDKPEIKRAFETAEAAA